MKRESNFRGALGQAIRATQNIAQPIESGTTGLGIPDMFIRTSKVSVWAELKNEKYRISYPYHVPFRPGQASWLERHYRLGGISVLGISTPDGDFFFVNEHIHRIYEDDLSKYCNYYCTHIIGREFVSWLNSLDYTVTVSAEPIKLNL